VTISIHRGIGAGVILHRDLFRGEHGDAGEIGQTILSVTTDAQGQAHAVRAEEISSEDAIIRQVEEKKGLKNLERPDIVSLYEQHDPDLAVILQRGTIAISSLIYNTMRTLDPDAFFLNSPLIEEIPDLLTQIRSGYQELAHNDVTIDLTTNARLATVLGGCSLITHQVMGLNGYELVFERPQNQD